MAYSTSRYFLYSLVLGAGCGSVTDETTTTDDPAPTETPDPTPPTPPTPGDAGVAFRFFTSDAGGTARDVFTSVDDAFLTAGGSVDVAPGDYYFSVVYVVCPPNMPNDTYHPAQSPVACRGFRVGANGNIVAGAAVSSVDGILCQHASSATGAGLALGVAPFELHSAACGTFYVRVIPSGLDDAPVTAVTTLAFSAPVVHGPLCGNGELEDGEYCDDGNLVDHDGCSASCIIEPGCGATAQ